MGIGTVYTREGTTVKAGRRQGNFDNQYFGVTQRSYEKVDVSKALGNVAESGEDFVNRVKQVLKDEAVKINTGKESQVTEETFLSNDKKQKFEVRGKVTNGVDALDSRKVVFRHKQEI